MVESEKQSDMGFGGGFGMRRGQEDQAQTRSVVRLLSAADRDAPTRTPACFSSFCQLR
jgi:hypothetical protein